jgi:hypothetical protein
MVARTLAGIVGIIFAVAAVGKALSPGSLTPVLSFNRIPELLHLPLIASLIAVESWLAISLLLRGPKTVLVVGASIMLTLFCVQLAALLFSKEPVSCGCLSLIAAAEHEKGALIIGIVRNAGMLAALLIAFRLARSDHVSTTSNPRVLTA